MANTTPSDGDSTKTTQSTYTSKTKTSTSHTTSDVRTSTLDSASSEAILSSSFHWGPAITAPSYTVTQPVPSTPPQNQDMSSQPTAGFSTDAKKTVIAVTTIGKHCGCRITLTTDLTRWHHHTCISHIRTVAAAERPYLLGHCSLSTSLRHHHSRLNTRRENDSSSDIPRDSIFRALFETRLNLKFR